MGSIGMSIYWCQCQFQVITLPSLLSTFWSMSEPASPDHQRAKTEYSTENWEHNVGWDIMVAM